MYSYNTAGPFGLEDQVSTSGPGMALIYQLLIPFFCCIPIALLAAVLLMCVMSVRMWHHNPFLPFIPPHRPIFQVFGVGFSLGLWLYAGYEQVSSVAEEVEDPQRSYPRALAWVVPLSIATYVLPTACSLAAVGDWQKWGTGYFSQAATLIGGPALGSAITAAAGVMNLSLLNS